MSYRNASLLQVIRELPMCTLQIPNVCEGTPVQACHGNSYRLGKFLSGKSADCFAVAGCPACHHAIDNGASLSQDDRQFYWSRAFERTTLWLWDSGRVRVNGDA